MRIGLFGGSFNPPHEGHLLVALQSLKRLELDALWVMVSPGNPLKDRSGLAPLAKRLSWSRRLFSHPRIRVTGFEAAHGLHYTFQTLSFLRRRLPDRKFVWIMGGDSLRDLHRWVRWRDMAQLMPISVYMRPGTARHALASPAATALGPYRMDESDASLLADCAAPAWVYLQGLASNQSSTAIRSGQ